MIFVKPVKRTMTVEITLGAAGVDSQPFSIPADCDTILGLIPDVSLSHRISVKEGSDSTPWFDEVKASNLTYAPLVPLNRKFNDRNMSVKFTSLEAASATFRLVLLIG